jgi:chaperonin cofactor prefoldin
MDRFKVYEINKAERDVRIGTSDTTKCFEKDKRWIHYRQLPSTCEHLCQRVGETVEIGTREQFEEELREKLGAPRDDDVVEWVGSTLYSLKEDKRRVDDQLHEWCLRKDELQRRLAELEKQNEELREDACAANMLATERKADFDSVHKRAAKLERQLSMKTVTRQDLLNRIAKQSAIIRDNEHVIEQQHDHIRKLETKNQELFDCLGSLTVQRDEAEKNIDCFYHEDDVVPEQDESRRVVKRYSIEGTLSKDDFIALDNGGKFTIKDDEEYLNAKYHNHRARVTLEILDKTEPRQ